MGQSTWNSPVQLCVSTPGSSNNSITTAELHKEPKLPKASSPLGIVTERGCSDEIL